jgi:aquaporin Z
VTNKRYIGENDEKVCSRIYLISIPVTNTSVNPARSTGVALYAGGWAISQLWLFWVAPIIGAVLGGIVYRFIGSNDE